MRYTLFLFHLVFLTPVFSQSKTLPHEVIVTINDRIRENLNPSIAIGIIDKNGPRYYSFGTTKQDGKKVNEHSIYEIGSISKVFTATLLADQVVKGNMSTEDPIEKYLPSDLKIPAYEGHSITLGQLSDHTSSLPRMPDNFHPADDQNPYADYSVQQIYEFLASHTLRRPVGSEYEYSNLAVGLLGHILSLHAKTSYEQLLEDIITGPLDMTETKIVFDKNMKNHLAFGHHEGTQVVNWDLPTLAGAGGIRSSVYDMLKFLAAQMKLMNTPLQEAIELTHQPRHLISEDEKVGLGWHIVNSGIGDLILHEGATGGYSSFAGFSKEKGIGVVVLTNSNKDAGDIGMHLLDPSSPLMDVKPQITTVLQDYIKTNGADGLIEKFDELTKKDPGKYAYSEMNFNQLGYYYLNQKNFKAADAVFLLNIREYPNSSNVYDSYAESRMEAGHKEDAILYYQKSLELNPANMNAISMLSSLGVNYTVKEVQVDTATLDKLTGTYQLFPGFNIIVTRSDQQLWAQATGQNNYEIFPKSELEYYYKVVDAQIRFIPGPDGSIQSLSIHQNGKDTIGKKIK